ncbi:MAG TPA: FAD-dependent oxidoreductase [Thermoplasmata archaeon]|nr:FAD-dependent oxidoreductase [Thermoplasmata archaeon]
MSGMPSASSPEPSSVPRVGSPSRKGLLPLLQRSIRYHRPRAPFCGVGYCTNCLVRVDGRTNVRACREGFDLPGMKTTANAWPSPSFDLLGIVDVVFPRGIDTLRGFRRPAAFTSLYQRVVRRLSGYDDPPTEATQQPPPASIRRIVEVAVVGGGVSGSAAAGALLRSGVGSVVVLDRDARASTLSGAEMLGRTTAVFLPPPDPAAAQPFSLAATNDSGQGVEVRARSVIVATGGYDASLLFSGNDRPGVLTAEGAFALSAPGPPPFNRAVVFGGGERAREVLARFPSRISAIAAPGDVNPDLTRLASEQGVPLYPRSLVLSTVGRRRVRGLTLRTRSDGPSFRLGADAIILAHRRVPHPQLFFQAGALMQWRSRAAAYFPIVSETGQTTVPGLYAVGEAAGVFDPAAAVRCAQLAATSIVQRDSSAPSSSNPPSMDLPGELEGYYRELLRQPRGSGKWIACPCEDVLLHEVEDAERRGYRGIEVIKRYTGLGTGLCQGRYCLPDAVLLLSILEQRRPSEVGYITQRPPVLPTSLGALASFAGPPDEKEAP